MSSIHLKDMTGTALAAATLSPDSNELSIIFKQAECINDAKDQPGRIESLDIHLHLELQLDAPSLVKCDARGAFINLGHDSWSQLSINMAGRRKQEHGGEESRNFSESLTVEVKHSCVLYVRILAQSLRDASDAQAVASVYLDTLDFAIFPIPQRKLAGKNYPGL
ncbi:hypothetical protein V8J88_08350 [Massilia sp. W12]|uniref:hypothetical protein n=1 Tax=Massilia sp. W12 TaxID=3126507 RepID=UPI0030D09D1E